MPSFASRFAVTALLVMAFTAFASSARSEPVAQVTPPDAVTEAVAASPSPGSPAKVVVGAYINDIQELDFKSNSYAIDLCLVPLDACRRFRSAEEHGVHESLRLRQQHPR